MVRTVLRLALLLMVLPVYANAQDCHGKLQLGVRSALIMGTMELSELGAGFDDLDFDGLNGPHISGVFVVYQVKPFLWLGFETLAANSDQDKRTTMNYQAAGPVVELSHGEPWSVTGGVHVGGLIASAMRRDNETLDDGVSTGAFYKESGGFVSPYAGIDFHFDRNRVGLFVKPVVTFGELDRRGLKDFSAWFGGVRYTITL